MVAESGPIYLRGLSTQGGAEGGTVVSEDAREESIPIQAGADVAGQGNAKHFVGTTEGGLQNKIINLMIN